MRDRLPTAIAVALAPALAATSFTRLFSGFAWWYAPVVVSAIVASATMSLPRFVPLRPALHWIVGALALLETLTVLCARGSAFLDVVPTPHTLATLARLFADGRGDIARLAAPVPPRHGLLLLLVLCLYLVTVLTHLIAVALARPTLAGLPLLALFVFPVFVLTNGVGVVPFLLGSGGYLVLLLLEGRAAVGGWGRRVGRPDRNVPVGTAGARIGVVALGLAVVIPLGLTAITPKEALFGSGPGAASADDKTSTTVEPPIVKMIQQLHDAREIPLIRVTTGRPEYLRLTALEHYDGTQFTLGKLDAKKEDQVNRGLPTPTTSTPTVNVTSTVNVTDALAERYLPLPGTPRKMSKVSGDWRLSQQTGTVFSVGDTTSGMQFTVSAEVPNPARAQLDQQRIGALPANLRVDTSLPASVDPQVAALARSLTARAPTAFDKAVALQNFLRGPRFVYDLAGAPTDAATALQTFLFSTHRGYCEQFATAMAVMLRTLGIPTRIAVGFSAGAPQADGTYLITNHDAHAWPEVWFPNSGWVPFEPTPATDRPLIVPPYAESAAGATHAPSVSTSAPAEVPSAQATPLRGGPPQVTPSPTAPARGFTDLANGDAHHKTAWWKHGWGELLVIALVLGLLALGLGPALVRAYLRQRRLTVTPVASTGSPPPEAVRHTIHSAWEELVDVATDLGRPMGPQESPRAYVTRLSAQLAEESPDGDAGELDGPDGDLVAGGDRPAPTTRSRAGDRTRRPGGRSASGPGRSAGPGGSGGGAGGSAGVSSARLTAALRRLASAEERARYAPTGLLTPTDMGGVVDDVRLVTRGLRAHAPAARRALATVAPTSVLSSFGSRARTGAEVMGTRARNGVSGVRARRGLPTADANAPRDVR